MATDRDGKTVALVPVAVTPRRKDRAVTAELLRFDDMSLRTYLAGHRRRPGL